MGTRNITPASSSCHLTVWWMQLQTDDAVQSALGSFQKRNKFNEENGQSPKSVLEHVCFWWMNGVCASKRSPFCCSHFESVWELWERQCLCFSWRCRKKWQTKTNEEWFPWRWGHWPLRTLRGCQGQPVSPGRRHWVNGSATWMQRAHVSAACLSHEMKSSATKSLSLQPRMHWSCGGGF